MGKEKKKSRQNLLQSTERQGKTYKESYSKKFRRNISQIQTKDFFSNAFTGRDGDDDNNEELCRLQTENDTKLMSDLKLNHASSKKHPLTYSKKKMSNTISSDAKSSHTMLLAAVESDSDDDHAMGKSQDFEFDDGDGDEDEPEVVGFGRRCSTKSIPFHDIHETEVKLELDDGDNKEMKGKSDDSDADDHDNFEEVKVQQTGMRQELANLSYEELEQLKQNMGLSLYNEAMFGTKSKKHLSKKKQMQLYKRENKNRPREMSSRARVPNVREVIHVKKTVTRDPRFDESCGELNKDIWDRNYDFLRDMQQTEVQELKNSLKNELDDEKRMEVKKYIQTFKNKEKSKAANEKEIQKRKLEKEENMKRMSEGKNPFYVKKSTRKFLDLAEKYEELKSTGKLEKFLKKKRKKNQTRDRKTIAINNYDA